MNVCYLQRECNKYMYIRRGTEKNFLIDLHASEKSDHFFLIAIVVRNMNKIRNWRDIINKKLCFQFLSLKTSVIWFYIHIFNANNKLLILNCNLWKTLFLKLHPACVCTEAILIFHILSFDQLVILFFVRYDQLSDR